MCDELENTLTPPENFDFPFTPYPIQHEFMTELYAALQNKKLGIFESPTGTGKSLSIICGALRWLKDFNVQKNNKLNSEITKLQNEKEKLAGSTTDWLITQGQEFKVTSRLNILKSEQSKINAYNEKIEKLRTQATVQRDKKRWGAAAIKEAQKSANVSQDVIIDTEDDLLLDEVISRIDDLESSDDESEDKYEPLQILICSRTHSQISQLVAEVVKSPFGSETRAVSLASRRNYCINSAVAKLKSVSLINERCLEMQKNSTKTTKVDDDTKVTKRKKGSSCQCEFKKQDAIDELKNFALLEVQDVEDLVTAGKQFKACPYYTSRKAAKDAQIVFVPYNTILHKSTREASGIRLKNNVVIIDEAHNLLEALAQMYSTEITLDQVQQSLQQLRSYKQKYATRFSSYNLLCINQLLYVLTKLFNMSDKYVGPAGDEIKTEIFNVPNFVLSAGIDNYNMFKLVKFCKESKVFQKLHSFATKYGDEINAAENKGSKTGVAQFLKSIENKKAKVNTECNTSEITGKKPISFGNPFLGFMSFLESLTLSYEDGRVIVQRSCDKKHNKFRFLLLNPASQFDDIVREARSVIVAGGTMKPISEFRDRLFISAGASPDRIVEYSCDHIIPPENILPLIITQGPLQEDLLFNFENRFTMGNTLRTTFQNLCKNVPGGIVVFFPSYKYEAWFWQILSKVSFNRPIFRESQDSASVDLVLDSFASAIRKNKKQGAMLLSVVGGKLSEGLNFSDDLGRCVVVVGMPYANIKSPELIEKMEYLDRNEGKGSGQKFYEALCMKSVNQCIGRAVRHRNDYATVLLLDVRYNRITTKNALPDWIKRSLKTYSFNEALPLIEKFFEERSQDVRV